MLLRPAEKILINSFSANSVVPISGGVTVEGYGDILATEIIEAYCICPSDCVAQVSVVCITIPDSCECPYEWPLTIRTLPCLNDYTVQQTFGSKKYYGYQNPSGATPTANETALAVAASINNDPTSLVTAVVGSWASPTFTPSGAGTCIQLTEKDCQKTCGFEVYTDAGVITLAIPHENAVLSSIDLAKLFPIQWGVFGSRPNLPNCGDYCKYHFKLRKSCSVQDISQANAFDCYEQEVDFYVNNTSGDYVTYWYTEMQSAFTAYLTGCVIVP